MIKMKKKETTKKSIYSEKDVDYASLEENANKYTLKCLVITYCIFAFTWLLNVLRIFIVDSTLMNLGFLMSTILILILLTIYRFVGAKKEWFKYLIVGFAVAITSILGVILTYHVLLACILPLIYAIQYSSKKLVFYTYAITVVGMFVIVMGGYYFGLCDANMVFLTTKPTREYVDFVLGNTYFGEINSNPWLSLPLFYVFPRCLILLGIVPVMTHVSEGIAQRELRELYLKRMSEIDDMTQLFNKNKYRSMVSEYYPSIKNVGVIFWDVNGLKETNDTLGHVAGDKLISNIAESIKEFTSDSKRAYRVGGDEFVMIVEKANEKKIKDIISQWEKNIEEINKSEEVALSAAVGFAVGDGADIAVVIKEADDNMYQNKIAMKKQRVN